MLGVPPSTEETSDPFEHVTKCRFPPLEHREKSLTKFGGIASFCGGSPTKDRTITLSELELGVHCRFVILSDVWLDDDETLTRLTRILIECENMVRVPCLFVFMGNFCSYPSNLSFNSYSSIRSLFGRLGELIASHERLRTNSKFLFIPGPDDIGPSNILPRCSLPKYITEEFQSHIPDAVFSSNPCSLLLP